MTDLELEKLSKDTLDEINRGLAMITINENEENIFHDGFITAYRKLESELSSLKQENERLKKLLTEERRIRKGNEQAQTNIIAKAVKQINDIQAKAIELYGSQIEI